MARGMLSGISVVLLVASLLVGAYQAVAGTVEPGGRIVVRTAAVVSGPEVLLGDIAAPEGTVPRWDELAVTGLMPAPERNGRALFVQKDRLAALLAEKLGPAAGQMVLPGQLHIQSGGRVMLEPDFRKLIVDLLTAYAGSLGGEPEIRDLKVPDFVFLHDDTDILDLQPSGQLKPGRVSLRISVRTAGGRVYRHASASAFLDVWREVPCAAVPLNPGDSVTPEAVTFTRRNLAFVKGEPWDGRSGPMRARRAMGLGTPLTDETVETTPVVAKGARLTLVYEGRTIRLEVPVQALADGMAGDRIMVRNLQSKKEIVAVVKDPSTVVVR